MSGETVRSVRSCLGCRTNSQICAVGAVVTAGASAVAFVLGYTLWGWGLAAGALAFVAAKEMC